MMQFLEFTFRNFWTFIGVLLLVGAAFSGVAEVILAFRASLPKETDDATTP